MTEPQQPFFSDKPVVYVRNTNIYQDINRVLNNINFSIDKGEFVYLVGRTGSGKSSLLKTLYADLSLQEGEIEVAGYAIHQLRPSQVPYLRRKLGVIFQDFQLLEDRNISENLAFVMKATGWKDGAKMKQRMSEVLMRVGLGAVGQKMPHQLSGGEQQRVVIARALINEPVILLADEPTGNLDPQVSEDILKIFEEINTSGTAILMATHDHTIINNYPARILKCENGNLLDSKYQEFNLSTNF